MKVDYVSHMGNDLMVVNAARVSFSKHKDTLGEDDQKLLGYLAKHRHWTPFSHPQICLRIKAPIFVRTQLFKHKVGFTENEVSRRYVDDKPEFYTPSAWRGRPTTSKQGSSEEVIEVSPEWIESLYDDIYEAYYTLLESGVAPEQARMVLPQSMYTEWYWTGSLAAYARMCKQRLDSHAQEETRDVAKEISNIIEPMFPYSWSVLIE